MVNFTPLGFWEHLMNNYCNCLLLCIYRKPLYNQKQWGYPESSCGTEKSSMFPRNWCTAFPPASMLCTNNISRWEINTFKRNTDLTKGNLLQIWIYMQRKCPRGIHNGRCQGPNPAALIRLLPQSGELGISHKVRMETISFPLNRLAETWKTVLLSSNGKRHCLQANSGREPSASTASMKRTCNSLKADFHVHDRHTNSEGTAAPAASVSVPQSKSSPVPFSVQGKVKPTAPSSTATSLPSARLHQAQSWWKGCGPRGWPDYRARLPSVTRSHKFCFWGYQKKQK